MSCHEGGKESRHAESGEKMAPVSGADKKWVLDATEAATRRPMAGRLEGSQITCCFTSNFRLSKHRLKEKPSAPRIRLVKNYAITFFLFTNQRSQVDDFALAKGLSGILADKMGLGKIVQTIGLQAHLKGMGLNGPYLDVASISTLSNWVSGITRFVRTMNALLYHGQKEDRRELMRKHMPRTVGSDFPVIVTSYEVEMNDINQFSVYNWKYLVVDEGNRLKNCDCKLLRMLPIETRCFLLELHCRIILQNFGHC